MSGPWGKSMEFPLVPLGQVAEIQLGKMLQPKPIGSEDELTPYLRAGSLSRANDDGLPEMYASPSDILRFETVRGDLIVAEGGDCGRTAFVPALTRRTIIQNSLHRVRARIGDRRFINYCLESIYGTSWFDVLCSKSTFGHLTREKLARLRIPFPEPSDQDMIAAYLDCETTQIDALVAAKERMVLLLGEGLESKLDQLLDPDYQSRETRYLPVRRVLRKQSRQADKSGIVTAFRDGIVMLRSRRREEGFTESTAQSGYQGVKKGDVVFHGLDGFAGAIGVAQDDGVCTPVYHVCSTHSGFVAEYVALALRALALSGYLNLQSGNVRERAVDFRNWDSLARIPIPIPSQAQQCALAQSYESRRQWTERLVGNVERQITLLRERRGALITAAVTGQLDIPEAA